MDIEEILNLFREDWTDHNQQVLKHCKMQAEASVAGRMGDYPQTRHRASVRGNMLWDQMDLMLEQAALNGLFEGITPQWIKYKGAEILTLCGSRTSLSAKHVLSRDEVLPDSENGYRSNNKIRNQHSFWHLLFGESEDESGPLHVVFQHGGRTELFAHVKAYFAESNHLTLSDDIMLLPDLHAAEEAEFVSPPSVTLRNPTATEVSETSQELEALSEVHNDDSQS